MLKNAGFVPVSELNYFDGTTVYMPTREIRDYNLKIVRSGDVIEIYKYSNKVYYGYEKFEKRQPVDFDYDPESDQEQWVGKDEKNLMRARREIRRVIWSNINKYSKFMTLTYAENMQDLNRFYYDWKMFVKSMKRKGFQLEYLYVLEHQERGAIHAHVVIFNNRYIPWESIKESWKHGNIDIHKIRDIGNLGAYVCKYLTKSTLAEYYSKSYHCSQGLKRPIERKITLHESDTLIEELLKAGEVVFTSKYDVICNDIVTNEVEYRQVKISGGI